MLRRPLRRLEAVLYAGIAAIVLAVLLDRALTNFALAERAAVDATLANTHSALHLRLAYDRLRGELTREREWAGGNPFALAAMKVGNFAGEYERLDRSSLAPGSWAFDRAAGELVYRPRYRRGLETGDPDGALRFRLVVPPDGRPPRLEPATAFRWEP